MKTITILHTVLNLEQLAETPTLTPEHREACRYAANLVRGMRAWYGLLWENSADSLAEALWEERAARTREEA